MQRLKNRTFQVLFVFLLAITSSVDASQSIFVYRNFDQKGDENQVKGVVAAYTQLEKDVTLSEYNLGDESKLKDAAEKAAKTSKTKPIVLAVGEKTVEPFAKMLPIDGATTVHLCHMLTDNHSNLIGKADFIGVPSHSVDGLRDKLKDTKTRLIETTGVSHNRRPVESYIGVILGGDAPEPDGKIRLFTEDNARQLARHIAKIGRNVIILVTNGPRTGKHDPKTLKPLENAHKDGEPDQVTKAFLDELEKQNVPKDSVRLFDFQFGESSPVDMNLIFTAVRGTRSKVFVPGESTSSISESIDVLPEGTVVVYPTTSMNKVHQAHVQSELEAGRVTLLDDNFKEVTPPAKLDKAQSKLGKSAAATVADVLRDATSSK